MRTSRKREGNLISLSSAFQDHFGIGQSEQIGSIVSIAQCPMPTGQLFVREADGQNWESVWEPNWPKQRPVHAACKVHVRPGKKGSSLVGSHAKQRLARLRHSKLRKPGLLGQSGVGFTLGHLRPPLCTVTVGNDD